MFDRLGTTAVMAVGPTKAPPHDSSTRACATCKRTQPSAVTIFRVSFHPTQGNVLKATNASGTRFLLYLPTSALIRVQTYNLLA